MPVLNAAGVWSRCGSEADAPPVLAPSHKPSRCAASRRPVRLCPPAGASSAALPRASAIGLLKAKVLSLPNFARVALSRKASLDGGAVGQHSSTAAPQVVDGHGGGGGSGLLPPLCGGSAGLGGGSDGGGGGINLQGVVYGAEAVRRGVDTLGVPPGAASWLGAGGAAGGDPLAAMLQEGERLRATITRWARWVGAWVGW